MFLVAVDDSHSGDSSIDLFADEQLLHHKARHFRPVIRAWSVPPKPKTEPNVVQSPSAVLSDSAHPIKTPEPISILTRTTVSTTENTTGDYRTTPTPTGMNNLKVIKPQSIIRKTESASQVEPSTPSLHQAQDISVKSSNLSHMITLVPTSTENITETSASTVTKDAPVTKTFSKEDASQTVKPLFSMESMTQEMVKNTENTLNSTTPSPPPQKPPGTMTESHSNSFTATKSTPRSSADARATTIVTSHIDTKLTTNLPKISLTQTTTLPSLMTATSHTTTSTSKPGKRKYSISWDEDEEVQETTKTPSVVETVVERNFEERPRKSGRGKRQVTS